MSLLTDMKNKLYNSSGFKAITGQDWLSTSYGGDVIPEDTITGGQKRYSSQASIPNLAKPSTMFFVYFNLNAETQMMINKKRSLIEYLTKIAAQQQKDTSMSYNQTQNDSSGLGMINYVSNSIDKYTTELANNFQYLKKESSNWIADKLGIDTQTSLKTSADYIPDKLLLRQLSYEMSKFVKSIDKPSVKYKIKEYNEYNRKRLCYDGREYAPINITFYDVKENPVQQFFFSYLKMIDDTFLCKDSSNYKKEILTRKWDTDITDWGFNLDSNFRLIDSISIIEMYMDRMMVYTLENPVFESIQFGSNKAGDYSPNEIKVTFHYEGITNDLLVGKSASAIEPYTNQLSESDDKAYLKSMINSKINGDIATFLQMRYKDGLSFGIDTAASFIKGILDSPKDERWDKFKSQLLDTGRKLGFADEINFYEQSKSTINNYKNSDNKGKYLFKMIDDPSSVVGKSLGLNPTTSANSILNLFK